MKISQKTPQTIELKNDSNTIDNNLELIKYATEVQSRIKTDINSDFVLAKFQNEKDKEAIKEMTNNAYLCKRLIENIKNKTQYQWNKHKKQWDKTTLTQDQQSTIQNIANEIFDIHMIRLQMKAILSRNQENNPILSGLMQKNNNQQNNTIEESETLLQKGLKKLKNKKEQENQQEE